MKHDRFEAVDRCIRQAAEQTAAAGGLSAPVIERFLRTGDETWDGAGSGRFTLAQFTQDEVYTRAAKAALRTLFRLLSDLLPAETRLLPPVAPEAIRRRVEPMVTGLVQRDWQEVALREIGLGRSC